MSNKGRVVFFITVIFFSVASLTREVN